MTTWWLKLYIIYTKKQRLYPLTLPNIHMVVKEKVIPDYMVDLYKT